MSISYKGVRDGSSCSVSVDGRPLNPRLDLLNLSAVGFDWSHDGNGSGQLALAIIADHAGDETALRLFEEFASAVIARLPNERWTLSRDDIDHALAVIETTGTRRRP